MITCSLRFRKSPLFYGGALNLVNQGERRCTHGEPVRSGQAGCTAGKCFSSGRLESSLAYRQALSFCIWPTCQPVNRGMWASDPKGCVGSVSLLLPESLEESHTTTKYSPKIEVGTLLRNRRVNCVFQTLTHPDTSCLWDCGSTSQSCEGQWFPSTLSVLLETHWEKRWWEGEKKVTVKSPEPTAPPTAITYVDLVFLFGLSWVNQETNKIIVPSCHTISQRETIFPTAIIAFWVPQQGWGWRKTENNFGRTTHKHSQSFLKATCEKGQHPARGRASSKEETTPTLALLLKT